MNLKRQLLYTGYRMLERTGLIHLMNAGSPNGNILVLHRVNDYDPGELTTPSHIFNEMLEELSRDWHVVPLQTLVKRIKRGTPMNARMVAITFDDGYKDNFTHAAPLLEKFGFPATFFVTSGYIGTARTFPWDLNGPVKHELMTWSDVRELAALGHELGAHTINHANMGAVALPVAREEITGSRKRIEDETGRPVHAFAFPFGKRGNIRREVVELIREAGFSCCAAAYGGKVRHTSDPFSLYRIPIYPNVIELKMELNNFMTYFDGSMRLHFPGGTSRFVGRAERGGNERRFRDPAGMQ